MPLFFAPPAKFEKKNSIINNEIFFERGMSSDAKVLIGAINAIKSCAPNWTIIQADLQNRLEFSKERMRKAINDATAFGYLKVVQVRQKKNTINEKNKGIGGQFFRNAFFFSADKDFNDEAFTLNPDFQEAVSSLGRLSVEDSQPSPGNPSTDSPSPDSNLLPMPNKPKPDYKAMKAMPVNSSKSRALVRGAAPKETIAKNKARLFKRPEDEEDRYQFLLSLEFGKKKEKLSDDTASYLAHSFTLKQLEDCYFDVQGKIKRGQNIRSPIAVFRTLLTDEHCPRGSVSQTNEAIAEQAKSDLQWSSLVIKDKYVFDSSNPAKDVPLNIDSESFRNSLMGLYSSLHRDYGQVSANY